MSSQEIFEAVEPRSQEVISGSQREHALSLIASQEKDVPPEREENVDPLAHVRSYLTHIAIQHVDDEGVAAITGNGIIETQLTEFELETIKTSMVYTARSLLYKIYTGEISLDSNRTTGSFSGHSIDRQSSINVTEEFDDDPDNIVRGIN